MTKATAKNITNRTNDEQLIALDRKLAEIEAQKSEVSRRHSRLTKATKDAAAQCDAVFGEAHQVFDQLVAIKPTTEAGFRALARAILRQCAYTIDEDEWPDDEDLKASVRLLLSSLAA